MRLIGITGGIGSGKSTLSGLLEIMGIPVYIADARSRIVTEQSEKIREELSKRYGPQLYNPEGLNKQLLASIIFSDAEELRFVNSVIHPVVFSDFEKWIGAQQELELLAVESAILFESGFDSRVDLIVNVSSPTALRIRRVINRDNLSEESVLARIKNQLPDEERNRRSDFVLINDGICPLIPQAEKIIKIAKN